VHLRRGNHVSLLVLGAATHGLQMQRLVATVPMRVVMDAPCSVLLVKQALPFAQLDANMDDNATGLTARAHSDNRRMTDARHPYETLTPDVVLDALASAWACMAMAA
jgi:hypothetical protein